MKQMRSRFRFLTLLLVCAFLLTAVLCAGSLLKTAGITLPPLPGTGSGTDIPPAAEETPAETLPPVVPETALPEADSPGVDSPGTDNPPETEYNLFGL